MLEQERLMKSLSMDGFDLSNIKFFLGDDRNVTQDALCQEAANALQQIKFGASKKNSIDGDIKKVSLEKFLK